MTWLGIDLGTSSVKVVAVDDDGRVLDLRAASYPTDHPEPGAAEQDPDAWWDAVGMAVRSIDADLRRTVRAIGLSGQMHGTVCLDQSRNVLRPAIIWSDTRGAEDAIFITSRIGKATLATSVGTALAAGFQAVTLEWIKRTNPAHFSAIGTVLLPKDYLRLRLTGQLAAEPSDAASTGMLDVNRRIWSATVLREIGIEESRLPRVMKSAAVAGKLTSSAQAHLGLSQSIPVCTGGSDASLAALGTGIARSGQAMVTLSSGAQVTTFADRPAVDPALRVHTFASPLDPEDGESGWYIMGATMSAGTSLKWVTDQILGLQDMSVESCIEMASEVSAGAGGLIYVPYISGERTPHLDANARGAFIGLTADHDRRHILRAVLEGAVFAIRDAWDVVTGLVPDPVEAIVAGGGARSTLWVQMVADMLDRNVTASEVPDASAIGAAILAAASQTGQPASAISRRWARSGRETTPARESVNAYATLRPVYTRYYESFAPDFQILRSV